MRCGLPMSLRLPFFANPTLTCGNNVARIFGGRGAVLGRTSRGCCVYCCELRNQCVQQQRRPRLRRRSASTSLLKFDNTEENTSRGAQTPVVSIISRENEIRLYTRCCSSNIYIPFMVSFSLHTPNNHLGKCWRHVLRSRTSTWVGAKA